jgi:hypothetical protein
MPLASRSYYYPSQFLLTFALQVSKDEPDSFAHLSSLYLKLAKEEDEKMTECWQKDAKPIIIFVRTSLLLFIPLHISAQYNRPVCSLPSLHHFLP